jgi:Na+/proline symporter
MVRAVEGHMDGRGFDPIADLGAGFLLWQVLLWVALMTVWQSVAMRTFSTRDPAVGKRMFTLTGFLFLGRAIIPMAWGIAALAFFWQRAEPVAPPGGTAPRIEHLAASLDGTFRQDLDSGRLGRALPQVDLLERLASQEPRSPEAERLAASARDRRGEIGLVAMPWMLAATLPTGLLGLVVAGMLAASISTYAGYFLSWASIIAQDVVAPILSTGTSVSPVPGRGSDLDDPSASSPRQGASSRDGGSLSNQTRLLLTRVTVVALTVFIMIWSLVYDLPGPAYFYLQVTANMFMAPTLIAVVGGLHWRRASAAGAVLCFLLGAGASLLYLVPGLGLDVATAGNLSWALALAGFVLGSVLSPPTRQGKEGAA